ncbi:MAG: hypothetical protein IJ109_01635 [Firmicutes bacterium]|nr:hypothetical protein [Bacillota bacterium]
MNRVDPFTRTPGVAGEAFINMHYADVIIDQFSSNASSRYIYKIVGLRGSGKSVEYRNVINTMAAKEGWLVYTLSSAGDPTTTLIAKLSREKFIDEKKTITSITSHGSVEAGAVIAKGSADVGVTRTTEENPLYYSEEATLSEMIQKANDKGYKVLVGIDDIAKTDAMVKFLSIWGAMLLDDRKKIYFVCTGLAKNVEDFANEANLTFFKRSDSVEINALNMYDIAAMYVKLLNVEEREAVRLAKFTRGYAYAYQVLGSLYFQKYPEETLDDLMPSFDRILFQDSYDLIWKTLTGGEKDLVRRIACSDTGKVSEIKAQMESPSGFSSLRSRLVQKHLLDTSRRGYISVELPRFREYIELWHDEE